MSIPFYRRAEYLDDGTYRYECLQCYQSVPIMGSDYKLTYCPHCGIKFEGYRIPICNQAIIQILESYAHRNPGCQFD